MPKSLTVLTLEACSPAAISCFGSSWNATPVLDSIAGSALVWDRCIATRDDPTAVLGEMVNQIVQGSAKSGRTAELLTDVAGIADAIGDGPFDRIDLLCDASQTANPTISNEIADTQLGRLLAAGIDRLGSSDRPEILWMHGGSLARRWDAPRTLRFGLDDTAELDSATANPFSLDDTTENRELIDDAPPPMFDAVQPPVIELHGHEHPDLVNSWLRTYGCQIQLLDVLLSVLLEAIDEQGSQLLIAGTSGFRLGQGGWIGHQVGPLRSRDLHIPVLLAADCPHRISELTSDQSAFATIARLVAEWDQGDDRPNLLCNGSLLAGHQPSQPIVTTSARASRAITTDQWFLVCDQDGSEHLFLKPDDIEDFNDVARLRKDVVDELGRGQ